MAGSIKPENPKLTPKNIHKKLRLPSGLFQIAFDVKHFQIKCKHPELSEREVNHRVYALVEKGRAACGLGPPFSGVSQTLLAREMYRQW